MGARNSKTSGAEIVAAAMQGDAALVEHLLTTGVAPGAIDGEGNTALGAACFNTAEHPPCELKAASRLLDHES